jgi:hypothetical protein
MLCSLLLGLSSTRITLNKCFISIILSCIHKKKLNTCSIFCCHVAFSQEHHSIYVFLLLFCPTSTKWDSTHKNVPHIFLLFYYHIFIMLFMSIKKRQHSMHVHILLSLLASTQITLCVQCQNHASTTMATFHKKHSVPHNVQKTLKIPQTPLILLLLQNL